MNKAPILLRAAKATPIQQGDSVDPADRPDITLRGPATRPDGSKTLLTWIKIAPALGEMRGHPAGPFTLDDAVFTEILDNFVRRGRVPIVVDAEHQSEVTPPIEAKARGWCHDLRNTGDALWGLIEWLSETRDDILQGRYCGLSPALRFESRDAKSGAPTGCRLSSIAVTNEPFIFQLPPLVAASDKGTSGDGRPLGEHLASVRACLSAHAMCSAKECTDLHGAVHALCTRLDDADGDSDGDVSMRLRDAQGAAARSTLLLRQATERIEAQDAELVTLRASAAERDERDLVAEVDLAFRTHRDRLRYGDGDRALLMSWRRSDPEGFRARHPIIDREHAHLLRDLVPPNPRPAPPASEPSEAEEGAG